MQPKATKPKGLFQLSTKTCKTRQMMFPPRIVRIPCLCMDRRHGTTFALGYQNASYVPNMQSFALHCLIRFGSMHILSRSCWLLSSGPQLLMQQDVRQGRIGSHFSFHVSPPWRFAISQISRDAGDRCETEISLWKFEKVLYLLIV